MTRSDYAEILEQGVAVWNEWRAANPDVVPDFAGVNCPSGCDLSGADFSSANLCRCDWSQVKLHGAILRNANLTAANFCASDLTNADLRGADVTCANFIFATLRGANLDGANLMCANFARADLREASFRDAAFYGASLAEADLEGADLSGARVYGVSVWNTSLKGAKQEKLVVTPPSEAPITVDHLEIAQIMALVIQNSELKEFLETTTSKIVLLLGRFSPELKTSLDALKTALAGLDYVPVIFDFEGPEARSKTETVSAIAHLARFVIVDVTEPKSAPAELQAIVSNLKNVPIRLICAEGHGTYAMAADIVDHENVVNRAVFRYRDPEHLVGSLQQRILQPVNALLENLRASKRRTSAEMYEPA